MQRRSGALDRMAQLGPRVIRDYMPQQHRDFFESLPFVLLSAMDDKGQPWATAIAGPKGFLRSPNERTLQVATRHNQGDPVLKVLQTGSAVGLLGIEPHTRRRNRMNGRLTEHSDPGFEVQVQMSFGNCPKYIQARHPKALAGAPPIEEEAGEELAGLDELAVDLISRADTFFIATAHPAARALDASPKQGLDVSHRGGKPGFVHVHGDVLLVPDFIGNFYFNTLGNLLTEPRCGLLFIDFERGDLLHLAATGEVLNDSGADDCYAGAQRILRLQVGRGLRRRRALPLQWSPPELSPHLEATGQRAWKDCKSRPELGLE